MRKKKALFSYNWRNIVPHQSQLHLLQLDTGPSIDEVLNCFLRKYDSHMSRKHFFK